MRVLLSCGGTGGHIYPAIAIADKIKERNPEAEILFVGTKKGMENKLVPAAGYEIRGIDASGFNRKRLLANFKTLIDMLCGSVQAGRIIREFKPELVIGTGAYVTGTVLSRAHKAGIPCYIHEQNALPGLTNRLLSRFADKVFISFKGTENNFEHPERVVYTGNPIRSDFLRLKEEECRAALGLADTDIMLLATGGSLGAEVLNKQILRLAETAGLPELKIFFVTGRMYYEGIAGSCSMDSVRLIPYADNMPQLMKAADLIISRAGAIAVSEITACGKPSVLIPSPNVTNNHQYYNAKAIADAGAAILIEEGSLAESDSFFTEEVLSLLARPESLSSMAEHARAISNTEAADRIVAEIMNCNE